tara:strand:- start:68318 stop:68695 length:378 start_codon:yes stop_codon:yes gene_type:complete
MKKSFLFIVISLFLLPSCVVSSIQEQNYEELSSDRSNFPTLRFLWASNGGLIGYYSDGSIRGCSKCDLLLENLERMKNSNSKGNYLFENGCIIEENQEPLCIDPKVDKTHPFWIVVNYKWLRPIH